MRTIHRFVLLLAMLTMFLAATGSSASVGRQNPQAGAFSVTLPFAEEVRDVAVEGDYAYVAAGNRVYVVDVSNPTHTIVKGQVESGPMGWATVVAAANRYVYLIDGVNYLTIIDTANPSVPKFVSTSLFFSGATDIAIYEAYAYVVDDGYQALFIIDVSDPAMPKEVGRLEHLGDLIHIDVAEHPDQPGRVYAYITGVPIPGSIGSDPEGNPLAIIDVTDPTQPRRVYPPGGGGGSDGPYDVAVSGRYLFVTVLFTSGHLLPGLNVLDVSDPVLPRAAGYLELPTGPYNLALQGGSAAMTSEGDALYEVEVSDVAQMRAQGQRALAVPGREVRLAAANGCVYAAMRAHGLQITCRSVVTPTPPPLVWLPLWVTPAG